MKKSKRLPFYFTKICKLFVIFNHRKMWETIKMGISSLLFRALTETFSQNKSALIKKNNAIVCVVDLFC